METRLRAACPRKLFCTTRAAFARSASAPAGASAPAFCSYSTSTLADRLELGSRTTGMAGMADLGNWLRKRGLDVRRVLISPALSVTLTRI